MGASLPVMAESPFALSGYYPSRSRLQAAWAGVTRPSSLLRTHAPDRDAPWAFALARSLGLRRLLRAPAANRPFPTLSLQSLPRCLDPYPAAISRCTCSFLPGRRRPHLTKDRFGSPDNPCMATSTGGLISGLQSFTHVQAPRLARPPGCSRRFLRRAARPFTPRISRLVTCPELRYRYVCERTIQVHPVNGEVPPVKGRPWKLPHYANRGKTSSSGGELASARSCFSTVRTALGKLRITGLLARFDVARSFPQFPRPLLLQPTIWTSERGADLGSGRCQPRPHLPIYRMTHNSHGWTFSSWIAALSAAPLCYTLPLVLRSYAHPLDFGGIRGEAK